MSHLFGAPKQELEPLESEKVTEIYIIEYIEHETRQIVALLEDSNLVNAFMSTAPWENNPKTGEWTLQFTATKYKKEPWGRLVKLVVLDFSHLRPKSILPKIRIPTPKRQFSQW